MIVMYYLPLILAQIISKKLCEADVEGVRCFAPGGGRVKD